MSGVKLVIHVGVLYVLNFHCSQTKRSTKRCACRPAGMLSCTYCIFTSLFVDILEFLETDHDSTSSLFLHLMHSSNTINSHSSRTPLFTEHPSVIRLKSSTLTKYVLFHYENWPFTMWITCTWQCTVILNIHNNTTKLE